MKEIIGEKNACDLVWLILHHVTTICMILSILATVGLYSWIYVRFRFKNYNYILARVYEQDQSVTNRVDTVTVLKYAIFDNSTDWKKANNISTSSSSNSSTTDNGNSGTSYSDLTPYCWTNNIYLAPDIQTADYMMGGFSDIWVMIVDAFFIVFMACTLVFIVFISFWPIKIYHIPFIIRSNKISWWTYIMRFKIFAYAAFIIASSFYHWYNMYDLSYGCLNCYSYSYNCYLVDKLHHGSMILGSFIMAPILILAFLNLFSDKIKYVILPILLINILFIFTLCITMNVALIWWII